jgi:hypothetical protein
LFFLFAMGKAFSTQDVLASILGKASGLIITVQLNRLL